MPVRRARPGRTAPAGRRLQTGQCFRERPGGRPPRSCRATFEHGGRLSRPTAGLGARRRQRPYECAVPRTAGAGSGRRARRRPVAEYDGQVSRTTAVAAVRMGGVRACPTTGRGFGKHDRPSGCGRKLRTTGRLPRAAGGPPGRGERDPAERRRPVAACGGAVLPRPTGQLPRTADGPPGRGKHDRPSGNGRKLRTTGRLPRAAGGPPGRGERDPAERRRPVAACGGAVLPRPTGQLPRTADGPPGRGKRDRPSGNGPLPRTARRLRASGRRARQASGTGRVAAARRVRGCLPRRATRPCAPSRSSSRVPVLRRPSPGSTGTWG